MSACFYDVKHKVVLITGATRGVGKSIALAFSRAGASIVAVGRDETLLEKCRLEIESKLGRVHTVRADISLEDDVKNMVASAMKAFGKIDVLVNNAGLGGPLKLFQDVEPSEWQEVFNTNLHGTLLTTKYVGREMIKKNQGDIVNISSVLGSVGTYFTCPYGVSKAGIIQFTRSLALEWARFNIRVNCVSPGVLATDMTEAMLRDEKVSTELLKKTPLHKIGQAQDVVSAVLFLASEGAGHITGENLAVDGGFAMSKI